MRLNPPPPLCDCMRPPSLLEKGIWRIRRIFSRIFRRRRAIVFTTVTTPAFRKRMPELPDIREIIANTDPIWSCKPKDTQ